MKVKIPFLERFREPMLNETKIWTSRNKKMGEVGDSFDVFDATFTIDAVVKAGLGHVAEHWSKEGCSSKDDFLQVWASIHRRKGFCPDLVFVHVFHKETAKK